jgi:hypothetical protein
LEYIFAIDDQSSLMVEENYIVTMKGGNKMVKKMHFILSLLIFYFAPYGYTLAQYPQIISVTPSFNQISTNMRPEITTTFDSQMDSATFNRISFAVFGERSGYKEGTISYNSINNTVSFLPNLNFKPGERIDVRLSTKIKSEEGFSIKGFTWTFRIPVIKPTMARFSKPVSYGGGGYSAQCVDMNGDGYPDIVTSSGVILINNGKGQFTSTWVLPDANGLEKIIVEDFNRDGIMDVLYSGSNGLKVGIGDGKGNFAIQTLPFWFYGYIAADFNSDGYPDIAGMNKLPGNNPPYNDTISCWSIAFNDGKGLFIDTSVVGKMGGIFSDILATDINNDGKIDVIISSYPQITPSGPAGIHSLIVYKNNGNGNFDSANVFTGGYEINMAFPRYLFSADFNNDGYSDIAFFTDMGGFVSLNLRNGILGTDTSSIRRVWGAEALAPFTGGDFNGDGMIDLVICGYRMFADTSTATYRTIENNCSSVFRNCENPITDMLGYNVTIKAVQTADLDNDGALDLIQVGSGTLISFNSDTVTSVKEVSAQPKEFVLDQNYPNPFNGETIIPYELYTTQNISFTIYNILGQEVRQLHDGMVTIGKHITVWDGKDGHGTNAPSGIYFIKLASTYSARILKSLLIR